MDNLRFLEFAPWTRCVAPYYRPPLPCMSFPDPPHLLRTCLRNLSLATRSLVMVVETKESPAIIATIGHVMHIIGLTEQQSLNGVTGDHIKLLKANKSRNDTAVKLFSKPVVDALASVHSKDPSSGMSGTLFYFECVCHFFAPFHQGYVGTPMSMAYELAWGIGGFRIWRAYAQHHKLRLHAQAGAATNPKKTGQFITSQLFTGLELLFGASLLYLLTLCVHLPHIRPTSLHDISK